MKSYYYKLIIFNLLQIFYLLGVGLLLTFDLLACVDSTGMLYHNSAKFCAKVLHMHILVHELVSVLESWEFVPELCVKCNMVQIKPCNLHPMSIKYTLFACGYKEILCAFSTTQH